MANADALHIGENSPEQVAFKLLYEIANVEGIEMRVGRSADDAPKQENHMLGSAEITGTKAIGQLPWPKD
jgi:hypothetical protein